MPWFMFMMGVSFTFSIKSMVKKNFTKPQITQKIVTRSIKLFALGLFVINNNLSFETIRIMGVLQRFGIGYLVGEFRKLLAFHSKIYFSWYNS